MMITKKELIDAGFVELGDWYLMRLGGGVDIFVLDDNQVRSRIDNQFILFAQIKTIKQVKQLVQLLKP